MRILFVLFWLYSLYAPLYAQTAALHLKDAPSRLKSQYSKALKLYQTNRYEEAVTAFSKITRKNDGFVDAHLMLGSLYFEKKDFSLAEKSFQKVILLDSAFNPKVYYTLALCQYRILHFEEARKNLEQFLSRESSNQDLISKANKLMPAYRFADSASRRPWPLKLMKPENINSAVSEYLPSLTADGNTMVFTRRVGVRNEDIYISYKDGQGVWSTPVPLEEVNSEFNEGAPAISADGNTLLFASCDRRESFGGCDLYMSRKTAKGWSRPVNMGDKINTPAYESQPCLADNGRLLLFVSNRLGTLGGLDIWYSRRSEDNSWTVPKNLGAPVNSSGNEECPFLHPNGIHLFYSSDGHTGMGENDIFYSKKNDKGQWSEPVNLGFPINGILDESSFITDFTGEWAFMASDRSDFSSAESMQQTDLFVFRIPELIRPDAAEFLELTILDEQSKKPVPGQVRIYRLENRKILLSGTADAQGRLLASLPGSGAYAAHIAGENYLPHTEHINTGSTPGSYLNPRKLTILLQPILASHKPVILRNVFFEFASASLKEESLVDLDQLSAWLTQHPEIRIRITGHTDSTGDAAYNLSLSEDRAKSVTDYLVSKGIAPSRLMYEGKGAEEPLESNSTEAGRQKNRRTEFVIIP
jgi:outer membrane protein OmpA-like peptidoglycan-associated protein